MLCLSDYITGFLLYNKKLMTCKTQSNEASKAPASANTEQKRKTTTNSHKKKLLPTRVSSMLMISSGQKRAEENKITHYNGKFYMTFLLQHSTGGYFLHALRVISRAPSLFMYKCKIKKCELPCRNQL